MSIEITRDIEVIAEAVEVTSVISGDTVSASEHLVDVEVPVLGGVTGIKKEYSIVGDALYASVTAQETPQWLATLIDGVVDAATASKFNDYDSLVTDVRNAISAIDIASNNYVTQVNYDIGQDGIVGSVVSQLDATYGLTGIQSTITTLDTVIANELQSLGLTAAQIETSYKGYTDASVTALGTSLSNDISSYAASITALQAAYNDSDTGLVATASATEALNIYVGLDGDGNPNNTGLGADVSLLKKQIDGTIDIYAGTHAVITGTGTGTVNDDDLVTSVWPYALWSPMSGTTNPVDTIRQAFRDGVSEDFPIESNTVYRNTAANTHWLFDATTGTWSSITPEQYTEFSTTVRDLHKGDTYIKYSIDEYNVRVYDAAFKFILTGIDVTSPYYTDTEGYTWAKIVDNDAQAAYIAALNASALADGKVSVYFALESVSNPGTAVYAYYYDGSNIRKTSNTSVVVPAEGDQATVIKLGAIDPETGEPVTEDVYLYFYKGNSWVIGTPNGLVAKSSWTIDLDAYLEADGGGTYGGKTTITDSIKTTSNGEITAAFAYDATLVNTAGVAYKAGFGMDVNNTTGGNGTVGNPFTSAFWIDADRLVLKSPRYPAIEAAFEVTATGIKLGLGNTVATQNVVHRQTTAPSASNAGDLWYDTDDGIFYRSNGTTWELVSSYGAPAGTYVNGVAVEDISTAAENFNNNNDRDGSAVIAPTLATNGDAVDHVLQPNGSADISFEWGYAGSENDIDGFIVYIRASSFSEPSYTFSINATNSSQETAYLIPANKRAFFFYGMLPTSYYTFGVQAYRTVDTDVNPAGVIKSAIVKAVGTGENPYQPASQVAFSGSLTGTINGIDTDDINQWDAINGIPVISANLVRNGSFLSGLDWWSTADDAAGWNPTFGVHISDDWSLQGGETAYIGQNTPGNVTTEYAEIRGQYIPIVAGKRYGGSAYVSAHRCRVFIYMQFVSITSTGAVTHIGYSGFPEITMGPSGGASLSNYTRLTVAAVAPTGSTHIRLHLRKFSTLAGASPDSSYLFMTQAMISEMGLDQVDFPPWSPCAYEAADVTDYDDTRVSNSEGNFTGTINGQGAAVLVANATDALAGANTANGLLADIADDNRLTASEKQQTALEWDGIVAEKPLYETQATALGITVEKTEYTSMYNILSSYVTPLLSNLTTTSTINGLTFRLTFRNYYEKRQALLNKMASVASTTADWSLIGGIPYETVYNNDDSVALGFNPTFSAWSGTYPDNWVLWSGSAPTKETVTTRVGAYAVRYNGIVGSNVGIQCISQWPTAPMAVGTFFSGTVDIFLISRTAGLPGILVRLYTNSALTTYTDTKVQPSNTGTGVWQRVPWTARVGSTQQIYGIKIYVMASYPSFASGSFTGSCIFDNIRFALFDSSTDNTTITIGSNGTLSGGGGGSVTITGLGFSGDLDADNTDSTVNSTGLDLDLNGAAIRSGKSTYASTADGWWIGKDSGKARMHFSSSTNSLKWTGDTLDIVGNIKGGTMNIGSGKFTVNSSGDTVIKSASTGARMELTNDVIKVYDANGVLRVKMGNLLA